MNSAEYDFCFIRGLRAANSARPTEFFIIGDASASGDIRDATFQAFEVARTI